METSRRIFGKRSPRIPSSYVRPFKINGVTPGTATNGKLPSRAGRKTDLWRMPKEVKNISCIRYFMTGICLPINFRGNATPPQRETRLVRRVTLTHCCPASGAQLRVSSELWQSLIATLRGTRIISFAGSTISVADYYYRVQAEEYS